MPEVQKPNSPFFIVGCGRSGTTLLRLLLCQHSRLHIPPETWFITPLVESLPLDRALNSDEAQRAAEIIVGDYRWPDMEMDAAEFMNHVVALQSPKLVDIINLVYARQAERSGKPRFGDKTPPYIHIIPQLLTLYPDAKFIHLIRDGRDVAISFIDADFHGPGTRCYHGEAFEWTAAIHAGARERYTAHGDRVLEVRYERLVDDVEGVLRDICKFLGEDFEPQMKSPQSEGAVPDREKHIHKKLGQPISRDAIAIWRNKISPVECLLMEASIRNDLKALGYPLRFSTAWLPLLMLIKVLSRASASLLDRAIPFLQRRKYLPKPVYI